jgi:hypothetical protein
MARLSMIVYRCGMLLALRAFPKAGVDLVAGGYFEHRLTFKNIHPGKPLTVWKWC